MPISKRINQSLIVTPRVRKVSQETPTDESVAEDPILKEIARVKALVEQVDSARSFKKAQKAFENLNMMIRKTIKDNETYNREFYPSLSEIQTSLGSKSQAYSGNSASIALALMNSTITPVMDSMKEKRKARDPKIQLQKIASATDEVNQLLAESLENPTDQKKLNELEKKANALEAMCDNYRKRVRYPKGNAADQVVKTLKSLQAANNHIREHCDRFANELHAQQNQVKRFREAQEKLNNLIKSTPYPTQHEITKINKEIFYLSKAIEQIQKDIGRIPKERIKKEHSSMEVHLIAIKLNLESAKKHWLRKASQSSGAKQTGSRTQIPLSREDASDRQSPISPRKP